MTNQEAINQARKRARLEVALRKLGERRQEHLEAGERLADAISMALTASEGFVSRTDAAKYLGIDRTSLYKTYLPTKETP